MRILIAEDEPLILKAIELKLLREGYEVISCPNGKEAMKMINIFSPDIIITDILMPFCSGLEIVGRVKSSPLKNIPIIVLSSMSQEQVIVEAFELGADDFIAKPFSLAELSLRIKRLIKIKGYDYSMTLKASN